jgi:hypothetical protein
MTDTFHSEFDLLEQDVPVTIPPLQRCGWVTVREYCVNSAGLSEPARTRQIFVGYFGRTCPQNNVMEVTS